jgi:hypothetical protein
MAKGKWIKSPWTISIATAIFSLLLTMGYDYLKEKPILSTVLLFVKWAGKIGWSILNFDLKVWWLIIVILFFILAIYIISKFPKEPASKPDFHDFREGKFKNWKWSWEWELNNSKNAWVISNMKAHCPNCHTPMIDQSTIYELRFNCPRCDFSATDGQCDQAYKIERIILDDIERKRRESKSNL